MDEEEFYEFCRINSELRIERTKEGAIIVMPPTYTKTGGRNFELAGSFWIWVKQDGTGRGFDSSTGFTLPNGAKRSPDVSWIRNERWDALSDKDQEWFARIWPDFVVGLRSETDALKTLQEKMEEYIENGAQLGWLIDPLKKRVHVYRSNAAIEVLDNPQTISGEPLLHGFILNVQEIWD
ncbi:MAG TPA: Uma2 family endonuclease [Pyrinomonadaceae bacterium]|nr:Uma2 family endonuclease [Pyrinomonadaceae bacterium]